MIAVQIDESRECELISCLNDHDGVMDISIKIVEGHTLLTVDSLDAEAVMGDMSDFWLDPHTHNAKTISTVRFL